MARAGYQSRILVAPAAPASATEPDWGSESEPAEEPGPPTSVAASSRVWGPEDGPAPQCQCVRRP